MAIQATATREVHLIQYQISVDEDGTYEILAVRSSTEEREFFRSRTLRCISNKVYAQEYADYLNKNPQTMDQNFWEKV